MKKMKHLCICHKLLITVLIVPILTGNPGGKFKVTKSRSLAKCELVRAMRSMMGVTCSTRDSGCSSLIHNVPLNLWYICLVEERTKTQNGMKKSYFCVRILSSIGRPISLFPKSKSGLKYSSGVMAVGLLAVAYSRVKS